MSDLDELYQEIILEHAKEPSNYGALDPFSGQADGFNPLCGDKVSVTVRLSEDGEKVEAVMFEGKGCAISQASASVLTEAVEGRTKEEVLALFEQFHGIVKGEIPAEELDQLDQLSAFAGLTKYPTRVKCATLAWHALKKAIG